MSKIATIEAIGSRSKSPENGQVLSVNRPEGENVVMIAETEAKTDFSNLLDRVENGQVLIVNRPEGENVVMIAESEFASLTETVYLLKTPANAKWIWDALEESKSGKIQPKTLEELKQELEIEQKEEEV